MFSRTVLQIMNKGIIVFNIFNWGGISSHIQSEIKFYNDA